MPHFSDFILELLRPWRPVMARRMFGGHGIYHAGVMFALIADGQLYLKVDDESRGDFVAAGLAPFEYEAKGRRVSLSYYRAPDAMLDDTELAREWAERGWQAALRAHLLKKARQEALPAQHQRAKIRQPVSAPRAGWAQAAKALAQAGDDALEMGEFGNEGDKDLSW